MTEDIDWFGQLADSTDCSQQELEQNIEEKISEFDGLVGRDAAAILVGRDLGVDLVGGLSDPELEVGNLVPGMSDVVVEAAVKSVGDVKTFGRDDGGSGRLRSIVVSDGSGSAQVTFWDDDVEAAGQLSSGDKIRIEGGYTKSEMSDYVSSRFGVPGVQIGDDAVVKRVG